MRRFVLSVFPTTRKTKGGRHTNGAMAADITQFMADPAIWMPSTSCPGRVITQPWCGMSLPIRFSGIGGLSTSYLDRLDENPINLLTAPYVYGDTL